MKVILSRLSITLLMTTTVQAHAWSWSSGEACAVSSNGQTMMTSDAEEWSTCGFSGSQGSASLGGSTVELSEGTIEWEGKRLPKTYEHADVQLRTSGGAPQLWIDGKKYIAE